MIVKSKGPVGIEVAVRGKTAETEVVVRGCLSSTEKGRGHRIDEGVGKFYAQAGYRAPGYADLVNEGFLKAAFY